MEIEMNYTHEEIEEMLDDLRNYLNDAFGVLQILTDDNVDIKHLPELYNMVETALALSTEALDSY